MTSVIQRRFQIRNFSVWELRKSTSLNNSGEDKVIELPAARGPCGPGFPQTTYSLLKIVISFLAGFRTYVSREFSGPLLVRLCAPPPIIDVR